MTGFAEYADYDGLGLAELVAKGEVSAPELVEAAIDRIERYNGAVNALVHQMFDAAREAAHRPLGDGPFAGVPFVLKDLLAMYAGHPTSAGSRFLKNYIPDHDTELVRRFRRAGLIPVGKTNTPEFGIMGITEPRLWGPSRNPWDLARSTGGSSGGTAAAVAARMVPLGHGGDGGGSIRIPAAHCGLVGLKPSRGRNPMGPDLGESWNGYVQDHVITRTVRDCAAMLDAVSGADDGAPYAAPAPDRPFLEEVGRDPGRLRIAFTTDTLLAGKSDAECVAAVESAVSLLQDLGHEVEEARPDLDWHALARAYFINVASSIAWEIDHAAALAGKTPKADDFELPTWIFALLGRKNSAADLAHACHAAHMAGRAMGLFHDSYDVFLTATAARPPAKVGELYPKGMDILAMRLLKALPLKGLLNTALEQLAEDALSATPNTELFNQTGQPAISLPLHWSRDGLPVGVQFAAAYGKEGLLLRLAAQLEQARPWADRRPPLIAG